MTTGLARRTRRIEELVDDMRQNRRARQSKGETTQTMKYFISETSRSRPRKDLNPAAVRRFFETALHRKDSSYFDRSPGDESDRHTDNFPAPPKNSINGRVSRGHTLSRIPPESMLSDPLHGLAGQDSVAQDALVDDPTAQSLSADPPRVSRVPDPARGMLAASTATASRSADEKQNTWKWLLGDSYRAPSASANKQMWMHVVDVRKADRELPRSREQFERNLAKIKQQRLGGRN